MLKKNPEEQIVLNQANDRYDGWFVTQFKIKFSECYLFSHNVSILLIFLRFDARKHFNISKYWYKTQYTKLSWWDSEQNSNHYSA